jgi:hypothetical protein
MKSGKGIRIKSPLSGLGHDWHKHRVKIVKIDIEKSRTESHCQSQESNCRSDKSWRTLECNYSYPYPPVIFLKRSPYGVL